MPAQRVESLGRPCWATGRLVDESLVEYCHLLGSVATCGDDPPFEVVVIQQDLVDLEADPPSITREAAEIRVGGVRISPRQATELAALLLSGVELLDSA